MSDGESGCDPDAGDHDDIDLGLGVVGVEGGEWIRLSGTFGRMNR